MLIIKNGNIKTMAGAEYERGYVVIDDNGKISMVGEGDCPVTCDTEIDAEGRLVTPGLVEAHCHLGTGGGVGSSFNESTDPFTPHMRAVDLLTPYSDDLKDAVEGGVTTVCTGPGSSNIIGGTFVAIKTAGTRIKDMIVKYPLAMKCAFGENPCNDYGKAKERAPRTRMALAAMMREFLYKAKKYYLNTTLGKEQDFDVKYDAMLPVFRGEIPMKVHVHAAHDIHTVLSIAEEFQLKMTIDHCTDGALVKEDLVAAGFPCFIGPSFGGKTKKELDNKSFATAGELYRAGVPISIITDAEITPIEHLPLFAGMCVSRGLPYEEGWRAITVNPANQTGIGDRVGSLEVGKDADAVVWTSDPLRYVGAHPVYTIISGKIVYSDSDDTNVIPK